MSDQMWLCFTVLMLWIFITWNTIDITLIKKTDVKQQTEIEQIKEQIHFVEMK